MILIAPMNVTDNYLEIVSLKSVADITPATTALINYFGKSYSDTQKIAMDDYFEGIKVATYYSKLKHLFVPFLAPNMTGSQIASNIANANKAFFDPIQNKLPDGTLGGGNLNMFNSSSPSYFQITDFGIIQNIALPLGSSGSLNAIYSEDVADANNISCGFLHNSNLSSRIGDYSLFKETASIARVGAATKVSSFVVENPNKLFFVNKGATTANAIAINNNVTSANTQFNTLNYDTTVKHIRIFQHNESNVGKTFTFAFIANVMTNVELTDFYNKTLSFLNSFGIEL